MTKFHKVSAAEKAVIRPAMKWWRAFKPRDWSDLKHAYAPAINTVSDEAEQLARACGRVARLAAARRKRG